MKNNETQNSNTNRIIAHGVIAGAIERLDKANNPHMKALQADLVHDLVKLIEHQNTIDNHGLNLPFCPRLEGSMETRNKDSLMSRMMADLQAR